jgi:HEAT repeat protein
MRPRGKAIALSTVTVGLVVLLAAAFTAKSFFLEAWEILQLSWGDVEAKRTAIEWLGSKLSERAIPALEAALKDQDKEVGLSAAWALCLIGPKSKRTVPALSKLLDHEWGIIRLRAADALGAMGQDAKESVPALKAVIALRRNEVYLAEALERITGGSTGRQVNPSTE